MVKKFLLIVISFFNSWINYITLKRKHVIYETGLTINGQVKIHGGGIIKIGRNVTINSNEFSNSTGGGHRTHLKSEGNLIIGNHVGISNSSITALDKIIIEDDVLIGDNCMICDSDFHSLDYTERMEGKGIKKATVVIRKGAFIGARVIILKGVTIGEKSVVGAGSVVTKDIPDNQIWAGNPAKFIKKIN